jgi:hypothetical protein
MSQTEVQTKGLSIISLLQNLQITDVSGIYITSVKTSTYSYYIADKNFLSGSGTPYAVEVDPLLISDTSGQYFDKTYNNEDLYLIIVDESGPTIETTTVESFTFQIPKLTDYPLTHSDIYTLDAGGETYEVPVTPGAIPVLENAPVESTIDIPPALGSYPIARIEKAFSNYDADKIIDRNNYETITADIEAKTAQNGGIMPQFKSFADYAAYKNSLSVRNYVANNP